MPEPTDTEIAEQLLAIQRELRLVRSLLVFVGVSISILLFVPAAAARIAEWSASFLGWAAPLLGVVALAAVVLVVALAVVSHYAPPRPGPPKSAGQCPPA